MLYETFTNKKQLITETIDQKHAISEAIKNLHDSLLNIDPTQQVIQGERKSALQRSTVNKQIAQAALELEESGNSYERAKQLEATGKHISNIQNRVLKRNRQALGNIQADIMTAKRLATLSQQNTIRANIVTDFLQTSIIFLCVAIALMFGFGMGMSVLKRFIPNPVVLMQALLILLFTIYIIIILYKVITNWNHYRMLYQERVFPLYNFNKDDTDGDDCDCPEDKTEPSSVEQSTTSKSCK